MDNLPKPASPTKIIFFMFAVCFLIAMCLTNHGAQDNKPYIAEQVDTAVLPKSLPASAPENATLPGSTTIDHFTITSKIQGETIKVTLKSELPDSAPISISASREFKGRDNANGQIMPFEAEYFSVVTTAGALKAGQTFQLDNVQWQNALNSRLADLATTGAVFVKGSISKNIRLYAVVMTSFPLAGYNGKAIRQKWGDNMLWHEASIPYSTNAKAAAIQSTDPLHLNIGGMYIISRNTPLMPHYNPSNSMQAIYAKVNMPMGTELTIKKRIVHNGDVWYQVRAMLLGVHQEGWVMAQALFGQDFLN